MARIDSLNEASQFRLPEKKKTERRKKSAVGTFGSLVQAARESGALSDDLPRERGKQSLEELLDGIFTSGEAVKSAPTVEHIKDYRTSVREFLDYIVHHVLALCLNLGRLIHFVGG